MIRFPFLAFGLFVFALPARADWTPESEAVLARVAEQAFQPWRTAWKAKDGAAFAKLFASGGTAAAWDGERELSRQRDGIKEYRWADGAADAVSGSGLRIAAAAYLGEFEAVDDVELTPLKIEGLPDEPAKVASAKTLSVTLRVDVRGRLPSGGLRNDRGTLRADLVAGKDGWRLRKLSRESMETLTAAAPRFEDATAKAGLAGAPVELRKEAIRRGGYALAVGDYDRDGKPDLYLGGWGRGTLYRNRGDGSFEDATKAAGLGEDTRVKAALIADMDGDGERDLVLQRFLDEPGGELVFYRNAGAGRFEAAPAQIERKLKHDRAMSMAAADFDADGRLDLYVGYPGVYDFTDPQLNSDPEIAHQALFMNRGGWRFEEAAGPEQARFFNELVRAHSALATDIDGDGRADLLVVDDRGHSSRLYLNRGEGRLDAPEGQLGLANQGWGMMAVAGDYDGDGREDLYFSNIDLSAGRRMLGAIGIDYEQARERFPGLDRLAKVLQGNRLYRALEDGSFRDVTEKAGVGWAGEAPAGAEWLDYDNDGLLDLYVANGLWSADPAKDHTTAFLAEQLRTPTAPPGAPVDANRVMRGLQESGSSFAGYQRNRLFRNNGDGTFTEVGYLVGADRLEDGYVVAFADYDDDGRMDLLLRNTDPPAERWSRPPLTVLRNLGGGGGGLLSVHLQPAKGADAFGARITVLADGKRQSREIRSVVGAVQSEQAAFFGLGKAAKAESLEIRWPSGRVDRYQDLAPGRIVLREGAPSPEYMTLLR